MELHAGVFRTQHQMRMYTFSTDTTTFSVEVVDTGIYFPPLLNAADYVIRLVGENKAIIVDGKRKPWSRSLHNYYFEPCPFYAEYDPKLYAKARVKDQDFYGWLEFDKLFHIQKLVPTVHVDQYVVYVKQGDFKSIVHVFGGCVDPTQLARFVGPSSPLIAEAHVLRQLSTAMKKTKRVWLSTTDIQAVLYESELSAACGRLVSADVVVCHGEGETMQVALKWASCGLAEAENAYQQGLFHLSFKPGSLATKALGEPLSKPKTVDPRLPVHRLVDHCQIPTSFLTIPIPDMLPEFSIPVEKFPSYGDMVSAMGKRIPASLPIVCVSMTGTFRINESVPSDTVQFTSNQNTYAKWTVAKVTQNVTNENMFVVTPMKGNASCMHKTLLNNNTDILSTLRFSQLEKIKPSLQYGVIIALYNSMVDEEWLCYLQKLTTNNKVYCVQIETN